MSISKVSNNDNLKEFIVENGNTFATIGDKLKKEKLIKSTFFYKIYIKLNNPNGLQQGVYYLSENMSLKEIINELTSGTTISKNIVKLTFKEGINMRRIVSIITENTDITEEQILEKLKDKVYLESLIQKYWFLTDEILNDKIYYALEGYLYPDTYQIIKNGNIEDIFKTMLDNMQSKLEAFKDDITKSNYSIHKIITMASIIELEAANSGDRNGVAGVFYNRLKANWSLGSDVTTYYGIKVDMSERDLYQSELNTANAYNTRHSSMAGKLPVSPICIPSLESIKAAIYPTEHNNYYFVADKNKKTYFFKNYNEHISKITELKSIGLWYEY